MAVTISFSTFLPSSLSKYILFFSSSSLSVSISISISISISMGMGMEHEMQFNHYGRILKRKNALHCTALHGTRGAYESRENGNRAK